MASRNPRPGDKEKAAREHEDWLVDWSERAAIREYDGGQTREESERGAHEDMARAEANVVPAWRRALKR